ncbi:MAG: helicase C-terminal domain-containing protein [Anaerolineaceae bacterium]
MTSIVALDLETTGLDPQKDTILEIGAVRFNGHRIEDEFSMLVNPRRPIPAFISQLTHITDDMVRNAPRLNDVLPELDAFVGDAPIVGHNVRFDLSFLQREGLFYNNDSLDTYELAAVLLPTASRYNLGALAQSMGIMPGDAHRALADARMTQALLLRLYDKAMELPLELVAELVRLGEPLDWGANWVFQHVLRARAQQPISARRAAGSGLEGPLFEGGEDLLAAPLSPNDTLTKLNVDEVAALLEYGGPFARYFPGYEQRSQQVEMLRGVTEALSEGYHLMVEAGTGTGKSFAYLTPAALWAVQNNTRVVISTNTINLQEQLIKKDIPDLRAALGIDLRAVVLKGRGNYLCPRKLSLLRQRGPENADELRVLAKVLVWLGEGGTGDRGEINLNGPAERDIWARLSAEDEGCKMEVCIKRTGGNCPFYRVRQAAQAAHLLVVNHALLLADVATGSLVLPEYDFLIVDEAHHLESAITGALSFKISQGDFDRMLRELGGSSSGLLGRYLTLIHAVAPPSEIAAQTQIVSRATDLAYRLDNLTRNFFYSVDQFLADQREGRPVGIYAHQERILPATRSQPAWTEVEMAWDVTQETIKLLLNLLENINQTIGDMADQISDELEDLQGNLGNLYRRMNEAETNLSALVLKPESDRIYWAEINPNGNRLSLQVAPLMVGPMMEKYLWHQKSSMILTSATLTTNGEFDYLRSRLNADEANELTVGSPFDYETSALVYVANDIPEPSDVNGHQRAVESGIIRMAKATGGRMLVLFTSYAQLKRTAQVITGPLAEAGIEVYEQGDGASANTLLENFREATSAVLLGTRSFWEGVDIPGEALSALVIVKLPFDVPSDPIIAARSETFDDPFHEYSLPEAILRFRQGFGRLIRTQSDRGVVAILDRRVISKPYGRMFLESLPECTVRSGSIADLPRAAAQWLNK